MKLFNVLVHVLTETNRHAGHADILREQLDNRRWSSMGQQLQQPALLWSTAEPKPQLTGEGDRLRHEVWQIDEVVVCRGASDRHLPTVPSRGIRCLGGSPGGLGQDPR